MYGGFLTFELHSSQSFVGVLLMCLFITFKLTCTNVQEKLLNSPSIGVGIGGGSGDSLGLVVQN